LGRWCFVKGDKLFEDIVVEHMDAGVRSKIVDDPNLPDTRKEAVLRQCQVADDEGSVSEAFGSYATTSRLVGLTVPALNAADHLGHIKTVESVARYMAWKLGRLEVDVIQDHLRALSYAKTSLERREAVLWIEEELLGRFPNYTVSSRPSWLFEREVDRSVPEIFSAPNCGALPCRLGLPEPMLWGDPPYHYPRNIEFIGFSFEVTSVVGARRPTALDGDYESVKKIWQIGGQTQPLPHGPDDMKALGGLPELVSEPVRLSLTQTTIYVFDN